MISHKRSTVHEYSMPIRRSDSSMKNSARVQGRSKRGEDLGMNYSSNALHISVGKVGRCDGTSQTEGRRTWRREGVFKKRHKQHKPGKICNRWFGRMLVRWSLEAWNTPRVTQPWCSKLFARSPLQSTEIVLSLFYFSCSTRISQSRNCSEGRAGVRQFSKVRFVSVCRAQWQIDNPFSRVTFGTFWVFHLMFNVWILWVFQGIPCPSVGMESRLTSGGMRFQAAIDIHVRRNGEGGISFFPASYSMAKARTPKSPCDIFFRVEGTRFFVCLFTICRGRVEAFGRLVMKK